MTTYRRDTMNWQGIIAELRGWGVKNRAISLEAGVSLATIDHLSKGRTKEPPYSVGVKILELKDHLGRP